jgi:hypothetical protein
MRRALTPHPSSQCRAVTAIEVDAVRLEPGTLSLTYTLRGAIDDVALPERALPMRADELWRHTCFEAFIRAGAGDAYYEFNFAPSTQWAAYRFDSYRAGMSVAYEIAMPAAEVTKHSAQLTLRVPLSLPNFPASRWRMALSAVIEETNGAKSYWALAHAPGKPDFHHADAFALELPLEPS